MELKKRYIIIGIFIVLFILILLAVIKVNDIIKTNEVNDNLWYENWNQTMELLGEALINKDIELLDELFDPECEVMTRDAVSKYSYERKIIEEIWNTNDFEITDYNYSTLDWTSGIAHCAFEIRIVDTDRNEYSWYATVFIIRIGSSDCIIDYIHYGSIRPINTD